MDGVVADFDKHKKFHQYTYCPEDGSTRVHKGFFTELEFIEGAFDALHELAKHYDIYFLSTPQWSNPNSYSEKREWVEKKYGDLMFKRLILSHHKHLLKGDYLIDDNVHEGFEGEHIHFGTKKYPNWKVVLKYLLSKKDEKKLNVVESFIKKIHDFRKGCYHYNSAVNIKFTSGTDTTTDVEQVEVESFIGGKYRVDKEGKTLEEFFTN